MNSTFLTKGGHSKTTSYAATQALGSYHKCDRYTFHLALYD